MMGRREIGMLMGLSVDRLNRHLEDFDNLLELAAQTGTLPCIDGVVYGPASEHVEEMLSLQAQAMFGVFATAYARDASSPHASPERMPTKP
jgi:hypothetical protein